MFDFIKYNSYVNSERIDYAREQIVKYADYVGLMGIVSKINNVVSPYFQSDQIPGRLWLALREKITTSSYAVRLVGVFSFTMIAAGCAYYKMKKNEQQNQDNPDPILLNNNPINNEDGPHFTINAAPTLAAAVDDGLVTHNRGPSYAFTTSKADSSQGSSRSPTPHSQESDQVSAADVRKRLEQLRTSNFGESMNAANMNHLFRHLNTIQDLHTILAQEVVLFLDEAVAGTDVKGQVDYKKKRSDEMEAQIKKMVNDLAVAAIRDDLGDDAQISADQINQHKDTYLEMYRENAILALDKEANGVASKAYFNRELSSKFEWEKMKDDGDCFFHAIGFNVNKDQAAVRKHLLENKQLKKKVER